MRQTATDRPTRLPAFLFGFVLLFLLGPLPSVQAQSPMDSLALPADASPSAASASPLAPVPDSSPRQTFKSFQALTRNAENSLLQALEIAADNDAIFDTPQLKGLKQQALDDLTKAAATLDLSAIAPASRHTVGINSVLLLKEIMDRIALPQLDDIPGMAAVEGGAAAHGWAIPGTQIRMTRVETPNGAPRFLFSSETVRQLPQFYALVRELPRHTASQIDFYQSFVLGPGLSMPIEFYRYVLQLPGWMLVDYQEQAVWQWIGFAVLTAAAGSLVFLLLRWEGRRPQPVNVAARSLRRIFTPLAAIALLAGYHWLSDSLINLTGDVLAALDLAVLVLQAIALAAAIVLTFNAIAALIVAMPTMRKESLDASLIRLVLRVVGILVAGYVLSLAATRVGIPLYGIIASLGVGGLALALAVRPTLENFIGGIILYADRPVKVGDFCKFGGMLGTVEAIGLRSTKVRGLDRTLVTVQNAEFAQMSITNYTRRDSNLMNPTIRLRYGTTREQLSAVIGELDAMLRNDERVNPTTVRVCLRQLGTDALDLEIWAYVLCADWGQFLKIQEDLFMKMIEIVQSNGCAFALPSRTTYLGADQLADEQAEALRGLADRMKVPLGIAQDVAARAG